MMKHIFRSTPVMLTDNSKKQRIYSVLVLVVALGQFMCAYGSGGASGADSVSGWVHTAMNIANTMIGISVLIPTTRVWGAAFSSIILAMSMAANYKFYGAAYFLKLLPFDGSLFILSIWLAVHYWPDARQMMKTRRT